MGVLANELGRLYEGFSAGRILLPKLIDNKKPAAAGLA